MRTVTPTYDADLEIAWAIKLGIIRPDLDDDEAFLQVGSVFRLPLVRERCYAKAKAAGQDLTFAVTYEREVLEALTPKEIDQLRQYVRLHP
jgi:hypothetical protein